MATTSVHLPPELLEALDRAAAESGLSRNRLIVESCRAALQRRQRAWPEGFFSNKGYPEEDLAELRSGEPDFLAGIFEGRRSRTRSPF